MDQSEREIAAGRVVSHARRTTVDPLAALAALNGPRIAWAAPDGDVVVGGGAAATVTADGAGRFAAVRETASDLFDDATVDGPAAARPRLFGGFSFHADHDPDDVWAGFPGARFVLPRVQVASVGDETWLTTTGRGAAADLDPDQLADDLAAASPHRPGSPPGVVGTERVTSEAAWRRGVETVLDRIDAGELEKAVLAQSMVAELAEPVDLADLLARLGDTYPDCYRFAVEVDGRTFVGATPERLVRKRGRDVATDALAGSAPRGDDEATDERLAATLRESEKDRHEHELVVGAIEDRLDPLAAEVRTGDRSVCRLAGVQHLHTPVEARLDADRHVLDLVESLHPTPAVGGLPPAAALRTIRRTETFERGWYAAPVGWLDADGDGTFSVAIRSAVVEDRRATLFAGNGIVADSDPVEEWEEVQLKYQPVLDHLR